MIWGDEDYVPHNNINWDGKEFDRVATDSKLEYVVEGLRKNTIYGFKIVSVGVNNETAKPVSVNARTSK